MRSSWGCVFAAVLACAASGCGLARSFINTQPVVEHAAADYTHPERILGPHALVYRPGPDAALPGAEAELLSRFAPVIVQGVPAPEADDYPPDSDRIGLPGLRSDPDETFRVAIDAARPAVFARTETERVEGRDLVQLVYVFWYPRRPVGTVQQGEVDGGVLRITLDAGFRSAVFEYAQTCGCLHGVFVGESVEAWAAEQFGAPEPGKRRFTERAVPGRKEWVVRDVVLGPAAGERPVLFVSAGSHECKAIQSEAVVKLPETVHSESYGLRAYEELERLPVADRPGTVASLFNPEGLVWGGKRGREEWLFADLDHPGWPRRLDRMKISWDEADWADPALLATYLRLPRKLTEVSAESERLAAQDAARSAEGSGEAALPPELAAALATGRPVAVLVTHPLCGGCRHVEAKVLPAAEVQRARAGWEWVEARLDTPAGKAIGNHLRVSSTPTLVVLDVQGRELRRVEGIASAAEFVDALAAPLNAPDATGR